MLNYARQRAAEALKRPHAAVLATSGPAGLLVGEFLCEAVDTTLFLLVPQTSDHLYNLEHNPVVTLLTAVWELQGTACFPSENETNPTINLTKVPGAKWCVLISIEPTQIKILRESGWGSNETIDLN